MADEIDLESGETPAARRRRERRTERSTVAGESKTTSEKLDRELHSRIVTSFERVVEWREARDDQELATAIDEDKDKMATGLVSLTHTVAPLRQPLVTFLGFVEPLLAFGRVGRILVTRWVTRRQQRAQDLAAAQAEWDEQNAASPFTNQPGPQMAR